MSISGMDKPTRSLLQETQSRLRQYGLRARRGLGQHFLVDAEVLTEIVPTAGVKPGDTVIEVGPGLGVLTRELLVAGASVLAVELDDSLAQALRQRFDTPKLSLLNRSVLESAPGDMLAAADLVPPYRVVANLPYYITAPVLRHFLEARIKPVSMVLMVQKEVAFQIVAAPGKMSLLSVSAQFYAAAHLVRRVPAAAFWPVPRVDSALVRLDLYPEPPLPVADADAFFKLVKAGFSNPRKQLANALSRGLSRPKPVAEALLRAAGIDPMRRAGTLSLTEWAALYRVHAEGK